MRPLLIATSLFSVILSLQASAAPHECGFADNTTHTICGTITVNRYCRAGICEQPTYEIDDYGPACELGTGRYLLASDNADLMAQIRSMAQAGNSEQVCLTGLIHSFPRAYPEDFNVTALVTP